jgi:hypothetical protein
MSHLTPVVSRIKNLNSLVAALKAMGFNPQVGERIRLFNDYWEKRGYESGEFFVQVFIPRSQISSGSVVDVGFRLTSDGTYELIADQGDLWWWRQTEDGPYDLFVQSLHEQYAIAEVKSVYGAGAISESITLPDGTRQFRLTLQDEEEEVQSVGLGVRR